MIDDSLLKEINILAKLKKERNLTDEEKKRQKELREIYLKAFRGKMKGVLNTVDVVDTVSLQSCSFEEVKEIFKDEDAVIKIEINKGKIDITYKVKEITKEEIIDKLPVKKI